MWRRFTLSATLSFLLVLGAGLSRAGVVALQKDDPKPTLADVVLVQAWYGDPTSTGADVTSIVQPALARGDTLRVSASVFTDTAMNHHKVLWLKYTVRGKERTYYVPDDQTLFFSALLDDVPNPGSYQLISANFQGVDVTKQVSTMLSQRVVAIPVSISAMGISDPARGADKTLRLTFKLADGDMRVLTGHEGENISLKTILPLNELPEVANGAFNSAETSSFASEQVYVPAGENALSQPGTFTISEGLLRPFQLERSIRADFVEHTGRNGSMAMWINPVRGRQPVLLWEEKVSVQPDSDYVFSCNASDISDSESLLATIVLEVDDARTKPLVIGDVFKWHEIRLLVHAGGKKSVHLKVWRDVLPYGADGAAALGLDDIRFVPAATRS